MDKNINLKYKDSIFRYLFKDPKNFTSLYKELSGHDILASNLSFYDTSSKVISKELQNDVSFLTADHRLIIMVEHQSTINQNMAIRSLLYYAELIKMYIKENNLNLFSPTSIKIPAAELYVAYNGVRPYEEVLQQLSDHTFESIGQIKVCVTVKNINYDFIKTKKEKNNFVGYSYWLHLVRKFEKEGYSLESAFEKSKEICINEGLLTEYLNRKEFLTMAVQVYTIEDEIRDAKLEGKLEGEKATKIETVKKALKENMNIDLIMRLTDLSREEIEKTKQEIYK